LLTMRHLELLSCLKTVTSHAQKVLA
jgi:hypothetical protein